MMMKSSFSLKKAFFGLLLAIVFLTILSSFPSFLIFLFPGLLIIYLPIIKKWSVVQTLSTVITLSFASTMVLFNLLRFIPLLFTNVLYGMFLLSFLFLLWLHFTSTVQASLQRREILALLLLLPLLWFFGRILFIQIVPGGADMATHSYVAKVIKYYNYYPESYYPIVPVEGFGFQMTGMSSVMAGVSLLSELPIYRSGFLLTVLIYPLLGLGLYVFLRHFFPRWVAVITVYYLVLSNPNLIGYLQWGAHPTILAILLLLISINFLFSLFRDKDFNFVNSLIVAVLLSASVYAHPIPFMTGAYIFILPILFFFFKNFQNKNIKRSCIAAGLLTCIFILPFLNSAREPSSQTYSYLREAQMETSNYLVFSPENEKENRKITFFDVPEYTLGKVGRIWFIIIFTGFFITFTKTKKEARPILLIFLAVIFLITNSRYWLLPYSEALLPGRVFTTALILFSYFAATTVEGLGKTFKQIFRTLYQKKNDTKTFLLHGALLVITLPSIARFLWMIIWEEYDHNLQVSQQNAMVTKDDLVVLEWIKENTSERDVIENNYGDAGIWIPAIAGRTVINNDASPHLFDALHEGVKTLQPTYAFIGSKLVYPISNNVNQELVSQPTYELVVQSGESKLYRQRGMH